MYCHFSWRFLHICHTSSIRTPSSSPIVIRLLHQSKLCGVFPSQMGGFIGLGGLRHVVTLILPPAEGGTSTWNTSFVRWHGMRSYSVWQKQKIENGKWTVALPPDVTLGTGEQVNAGGVISIQQRIRTLTAAHWFNTVRPSLQLK